MLGTFCATCSNRLSFFSNGLFHFLWWNYISESLEPKYNDSNGKLGIIEEKRLKRLIEKKLN